MLPYIAKLATAGVIKLGILRGGDDPELSGWALNAITCVPVTCDEL